MAKSQITRKDDGTITLTITIPADRIKKVLDEEISHAVENTVLPGFRKGKAPRNLVEANVDKPKIKEEVLRKLLPEFYLEAVKEHDIKPVITPRVHVEKIDDNKPWEFSATVAEAPEVTLNNYKDEVKKITAKSKIIIPGKETPPPSMDELLQPILKTAAVAIPLMVIEGEVERLLSQMLDEVRRLGLTLDQYLASTSKTVDDLKKEFTQKAENDIKIEFILQKIADEEKITVEPKEIDEALQKVKNDQERESLANNMYMLASILRQQKTLDFIKNL